MVVRTYYTALYVNVWVIGMGWMDIRQVLTRIMIRLGNDRH